MFGKSTQDKKASIRKSGLKTITPSRLQRKFHIHKRPSINRNNCLDINSGNQWINDFSLDQGRHAGGHGQPKEGTNFKQTNFHQAK